MTTRTGMQALIPLSLALAFVGGLSAMAETVGPVTDELGVVEVPAGEPLQIGSYLALTGPDAALGIDARRGIEIALEDYGGDVLGHPVQITYEDEGCSAEGGQTAATRLASNPEIVGILGSSCSSAARAGAPILWQQKIASVGVGPTAPSLTAPDRAPGFEGFIRVSFNDNNTGNFAADYAYNALKLKTIATIHDGGPYAQQLVNVFGNRFEELGGEITASEAVAPTDTDMRPVLTRIGTNKPDGIFAPLYIPAGGYMLRQLAEVPSLEGTTFLSADPIMAPAFLSAAGQSAIGIKMVGIDFRPEALGPKYGAFVETYKSKYGESPIAGFHAYGYDAFGVLVAAIEKVAVKDNDGNLYVGRGALNDALHVTSGYEGLTGKLGCNEVGDCASPIYAVWEYTSEDPASYRLGTNPIRIYP